MDKPEKPPVPASVQMVKIAAECIVALAVIALFYVILTAPLIKCKACSGVGDIMFLKCPDCKGKGKVTLWDALPPPPNP